MSRLLDSGLEDAVVEATARFLAINLDTRDPEQAKLHWKDQSPAAQRMRREVASFGQLLYTEGGYLPSRQRMDDMKALYDRAALAEETEQCAGTLQRAAEQVRAEARRRKQHLANGELPPVSFSSSSEYDDAVYLHALQEAPCYYNWDRIQCRAGAHESDKFQVGGIGVSLWCNAHGMAERWIDVCDRRLCAIHGERWSEFKQDKCMDAFVDDLATALAEHATMMEPLAGRGVAMPSALSSRELEERAREEFLRSRGGAMEEANADERALEALLVIARDRASPELERLLSEEACDELCSAVARIVDAPPSELGMVGRHAQRMDLGMLGKILSPGMPHPVRVRICKEWARRYSGYACTAIGQALARVREWRATSHPVPCLRVATFVSEDDGDGAAVGCEPLPLPAFAPRRKRLRCFLLPSPNGPSTRSGLDARGRRIVRLLSLVWQLLAQGALPRGVVSTRVLLPVCVHIVQQSRLVREITEQERKRRQIGFQYACTHKALFDRASPLSDDVARSMCELSRFSLLDLHRAWSSSSPTMPRLLAELGTKTRAYTLSPISTAYTRLALDALIVLMPLVEQWRSALRVGADRPPHHPLGDMLRATPSVRAQLGANCETIVLRHSDVREGPRGLVAALRSAAAQSLSGVRTLRGGSVGMFALSRMRALHLMMC